MEKCDAALATLQQEKRKESEAASRAATHAEWLRREEKQKESDAKWAVWVIQLQEDQAKKQKEAIDDYVWRVAELDQQCTQQDQWDGELQRRLHVSQTGVQSTTLYQCHGNPSVSVHALPPPPSVSQKLLPAPPPCMPACMPQVAQSREGQFAPPPHHPLIPANVLPQVPLWWILHNNV